MFYPQMNSPYAHGIQVDHYFFIPEDKFQLSKATKINRKIYENNRVNLFDNVLIVRFLLLCLR